jgi:FtsH-binding integral membrane protein
MGQPVKENVFLGLTAVLAVVFGANLVAALRAGSWAVASSTFVLMTAALAQWLAVRATRRSGALSAGSVVVLVVLGVVGLGLCSLDFVTGDRANRAFTVLFAAGLIAVVGGVLGRYRRPSGKDLSGSEV